jgi:Flp pilus assembly protein TadG
MTMWKRLVTRPVTRLGADERGAIAVQFALLLIPITILTFGLIDISRASVQKRQLQDALDAATLMAARSTATTDADLDALGDAALATEMSGLGVTLTASNSTFALGANNTVVGTIQNVVIKPIISNLWSTTNTPISASSTVMRSVNKLEVALVLDNTGSMASNLGSGGSKINALITASKSLVDVLAAAAARASETDAVKLSVVPFSMTVNVGSSYQGQSWLVGTQPTTYGADNFASSTDRFTALSNLSLTWSGCVESRPAPYDISDAAPTTSDTKSLFVPFFAPDEPDDNVVYKSGSSGAKYRDAVNGGPIANNWITRDLGYNGTPSTDWSTRQKAVAKYALSNGTNNNKNYVIADAKDSDTDYGPNAGCGIASLLRLTNLRNSADVTTVKNKLGQMVASGNTNVAMGAMWGWHTISPYAPFADGKPYGTHNVTKVIVLLTDGDNVMSSASNPNKGTYSGYGYADQGRLLNEYGTPINGNSSDDARRDAMDDRQMKLCAAARAAPNNVQIYAIGVGVSAHSKTVLQTCATKPEMYYDVTDAAQLTSVFNTIAGSIQNLRITK